jgi:hypothetical protein
VTLDLGEVVEFETGTPFVVESQDEAHPFMMFMLMGSQSWQVAGNPGGGFGDADFVISIPTGQYMRRNVFFADPTYPESNLVVVRARDEDGAFAPVVLDCFGELEGWEAVGDYEWTRIDLMTGDFQGVDGCSTGRHEVTSEGLFGMWVWGWGTPLTETFTANVSYGYPAGMNVLPINQVVITPAG